MKAVFLLVSFVLASVQMSQAQQSKKVYRIGYLSAGLATSKGHPMEAFRQALRDLDYPEEKTS
jgi:hypothetical protein